jgi:U4/U6.U5 tri-snRNP-associated protein 1
VLIIHTFRQHCSCFIFFVRVRNRQELHAKLKGATLGDDEESEDTLQWVRKAKKRERELAKKRQEEFESRDNVVQDEYTES